MLKAILFDLDGTLLPMDQDVFAGQYFKGLTTKMAPLGYMPKELANAIGSGTVAMVKNDGSRSNEDAFWDCFCQIYGEKARKDIPVFEDFYRNEFQSVQSSCGRNEKAARVIQLVKSRGWMPVLATNPIFPAIATESRIRWAGLNPEDFALYTTYENSSFTKPNPAYYQEILQKLDLKPEECVMVGNDAIEDTAAEKLGIPVFLLTECLINKDGRDISGYLQGDFDALLTYLYSAE